MNILLTNDDGYQAEGINILNEYFLKKNYNVFMVAPDSEKSGFSHSITLKETIRLIKQKGNLWVLKGTPVDCVTLGVIGMLPATIDVVVSGINHGPNLGKDIIYSGTAAAARQGGLHGVKSFALSINTWGEIIHFDTVTKFLDNYFEKLVLKNDISFFYNINFPNINPETIKGVKITTPCLHHYYQDELICHEVPTYGKYYWLKGNKPIFEKDEGTDAGAIKNGFISVSPIELLPRAANIKLEI